MKKLSVAYFGTPDFSAHFLKKLLKSPELVERIEVKFVVTQEDKPAGRKRVITPTPVAQVSARQRIFLAPWEPSALRGRGIPSRKKIAVSLKGVDIALVFAYGEIIPKELLNIPKYGFWNVHPSLLPKYRGPSPVAQALIDGEEETGVTLIKLDAQMDHGAIIAQEKLKIEPKERRPELTLRLTDLAFNIFIEQINSKQNFLGSELAYDTGSHIHSLQNFASLFIAQDHDKATYTKLLKKDDGFISFKNFKLKIKNSPEKVFNLFRGLYPWPGIWTLVKIGEVEKRLKITDMDMEDGKLVIKKIQLEGKKEVDFETFNKYYKVL